MTCRPARPCCSARALVVEPERLPAQRVWRWRFSGSDRSTGRVGHEKAGWHEWWIVRQGQGRGMGMGFVLRRCETRRRPAGRPPTNGPLVSGQLFRGRGGRRHGGGGKEMRSRLAASCRSVGIRHASSSASSCPIDHFLVSLHARAPSLSDTAPLLQSAVGGEIFWIFGTVVFSFLFDN